MSVYTIDWSNTNVDGRNTINGPDGNVAVDISTPKNGEGKEWHVENGMLKNWDVTKDSSADIRFSEEVENISFTLFDVDKLDEITIMAKDAGGNIVEVSFEDTGVHDVNGNVVTGTMTNAPGPGASNNGQDINVTIAGPIVSFWIVLDDGPERSFSGTVAVGDITFEVAPELDGYVDGTAGDDLIDSDYLDDPEGDQIDDNDEILPGEEANDDIVLAGDGNDIVRSGTGNDEVYGGAGNDMIFAGFEDDVVYGGTGNDKIEASAGEDVVIGGEGNDDIWAGRDDDVVSAGAGNDTVIGGTGDDVITGGKGDDTIDGGTGEDEVYGGIGADSILGGSGNDTLIGGNVDFDGTQDFNELSAGELIDGQYIGEGLTITSGDPTNPVMVFDTDNPTGGDDDLATNNLGNVLILSEDRDGSDPDDNAGGGSFFLNFDGPADVSSLTLLDADHGAWVKYYDMNGNLLKQIDVQTANNGQFIVDNNVDGVFQIEVVLGASGAIDNIEYSINSDDMDGDDTIDGEDGDDYIEGNAGDDVLTGGAGNDEIFGGDDADTIFGGAGDTVDGGAGGNDHDVLDLTGQGGFYLVGPDGTGDPVADSNGNGIDGTVIFVDSDGEPTGETLSFTEIEEVLGDEVNRGPEAGDDTATVDEDGSVDITVLANDSDPDGDLLTVTDATSPNGDVTINPDGSLTFEPAENFNGETTITYTIDDGNGGTDTATVTVTVNPVNDAPDAVDDVDTTPEDTPVVVDLLDNDTDVDGDTLTVTSATVPASQGTLEEIGDGEYTFTPAENFNGEATITYTIDDGNGGTDTATHVITVTPVNDDPIACPDHYFVNEDETTGDLDGNVITDPSDNGAGLDIDPDGDTLTVVAIDGDDTAVGTVVTGSNGGEFVLNADGSFDFSANEDFEGLAVGETADTQITYTVSDGNGGEATTTLTITVNGLNDAPVATDNAYVESADDSATDIDGNVLSDDTGDGVDFDVDGDVIRVVSVTNGTDTDTNDDPFGALGSPATVAGDNGGIITINNGGNVSFDPNGEFGDLGEGETATTTVTYTIEDENGAQDTATVTFTVTGTNDGPVAVADAFTTDEDTVSDLGNVLINDADPDGDPLTVGEVNGDPANVGQPVAGSDGGLVTINPDGTISFDPNGEFEELAPGESVDTTVTYTVTDPSGQEATETVTITVNGVNDGPDATDNGYVVSLSETAGDVDGNVITDDTGDGVDSDPEGDDLTVVAVDSEAGNVGNTVAGDNGGTFTINEDGTVDFDAGDDFEDLGLGETRDSSVTYTIADENGATDTATATFTVTGVNDGTVQGTDGNDVINADIPFVDTDGDIVDAGDGILPGDEGTDNDVIDAQGGDDSVDAGDGDDVVFGGTGDDIVRGGSGDDVLEGNDGEDMLFGGSGDDSIDGGDDDDKIEAGSGDDTIFGGEGNDDLWGASGDDSVDGGAGDDIINTAEGNDVVEGGEGDDVIDTGNDENPFTADPGQNLPDVGYPGLFPADLDPNDDLDTVFGGAGNDSISTGDDDDTIFGGAGDDTIDAGIDDDYVEGGEGNDTIIGSEGNDEILGGDGDDTIFGGLEPGVADILNLPDDIDLVDFNNNDTLFGGEGNDTIFGADDDDTLFGGDGDDVLIGGVDEDEQFGGLGNDTFIIDEEGHGAGDVIVGGEDPDDGDVDVLDLTGSNVDFITYVDGDPEAGEVTFLDGSTLTFTEIENVIPCFTPGTTIATPKGERLVEELREGDRIITRDNGIQEIRWVGRKEMSGKALVTSPHLKPILIRAGSLGNGLPERDMLVSPNHRCLVASEKTQLYFEEREVLAAAKHLVGSEGIHAVDVMGTAYIHFMFDRHEVVLSNGAWTESFQPGDYSLKGIGNAQRNEIFELFPELQETQGLEGYQSARRALKKHEAKLLLK